MPDYDDIDVEDERPNIYLEQALTNYGRQTPNRA
jgi:hypothetical protein